MPQERFLLLVTIRDRKNTNYLDFSDIIFIVVPTKSMLTLIHILLPKCNSPIDKILVIYINFQHFGGRKHNYMLISLINFTFTIVIKFAVVDVAASIISKFFE